LPYLSLEEESLKSECAAGCPILASELFRSLGCEQKSRLECIFRPMHYRRNQILFFEGGTAQHLFALRSGLVKLVKSLENGKDRIVRVLFPGEFFGLEALNAANCPLTAVILQDSEVCAVSHDEFFTFLRSNTDIALDMIRILVSEVTQVRAQLTDLSYKDARTRVATFLLTLIATSETIPSKTCSLTLPLSTQEIGEVLELSTETVSRTWGTLQKEGLIEKRGRKLLVQDVLKLENAARR
jgi:CRP-like cAMP-binding protein